jgi:hypothetical protein
VTARRRTARFRLLRRRLTDVRTQQLAEVRAAVTGLTRLQVVLLLLGAGTIAFGGAQLLQLLLDRTAPVLGVGAWWLGGPLIVDLIAVPIIVISGMAVWRFVPVGWRRYVAGAAALSVLLSLVALPFLTGLGRRPDNPSLLDRNYWAGYLTLIVLVWGVPLALRLVRRLLPRGRGRRRPV